MQSMNDSCGVPKGMCQVLRARHVNVSGMTADQMTLAVMDDLKMKSHWFNTFSFKKRHIPAFFPKVHPELNPIERVWAQLTQKHIANTQSSHYERILQIPMTVSLENIQNHFRKSRHFMFGYLEGLQPGQELHEALKKYKVAAKSH